MNKSRIGVLVLALAFGILAPPALAAGTSPTVVELFTSQGCSSCPPANANLIALSRQPGVLALSFAVTYWDYLGWKDTFDRPEYTDRQTAYEPGLGEPGPYTPQMVVNGTTTTVGSSKAEIEGLVAKAKPLHGPGIVLQSNSVTIEAGPSPKSGADVWLVRYDPKVVEVPVGRGENSGRTLPHTHVVHELQRLGAWNGVATTLSFSNPGDGLVSAVLVQETNGGPILAAASNG
ncbi:MAG: DUF1223 domain-containing protein [Devosia sp.]|nr:DUF1223 domain-containing protein [Devosia sp.]